MRLDPADIDAIAQRVVLLMRDQMPAPAARLVDAAELASTLGVDRGWVYAHAKELKGVRLGGPRGRLRFDVDAVLRAMHGEPVARPQTAAKRATKLVYLGGDLLPIDP